MREENKKELCKELKNYIKNIIGWFKHSVHNESLQ